jgi:Flp pilus assembly pilin Flp
MEAHIRLPSRHRKTHPRQLVRDQRGTSVVEFALILPVAALMLVGTVDLARGIAAKLSLEQAIYRTMERAMVGALASGYSHLRQEAATAAGVPLAQVTLEQWAECDGTRQADFDVECGSTQMVARYVRIHVWRSHVPTFPAGVFGKRLANIGPDGTIRLEAESSLRVQ